MRLWVALSGFLLLAAPAAAQSGNCLTSGLLRMDAAFARQGAGGTFDYLAQVTSLTSRPVHVRVGFRMSNAQVNPALHGAPFVIPARASRLVLLGNGREVSTASRIGGGVLLTC